MKFALIALLLMVVRSASKEFESKDEELKYFNFMRNHNVDEDVNIEWDEQLLADAEEHAEKCNSTNGPFMQPGYKGYLYVASTDLFQKKADLMKAWTHWGLIYVFTQGCAGGCSVYNVTELRVPNDYGINCAYHKCKGRTKVKPYLTVYMWGKKTTNIQPKIGA